MTGSPEPRGGRAPSPLKLCYVTNLFPPVQTGTSYYSRQLAEAMSARGHSVLVVTCSQSREYSDRMEDGLRVIRLPSLGVPRLSLLQGFDGFRLAWTVGNLSRATLAVRAFKPDLIHACGHLLDLTHLAGRLARNLRVPSACSIHTVIHHPGSRPLNWLLQNVDRHVHRRAAMNWFDHILTLDRVTDTYARRAYPGKPTIPVPWGVGFDFDRYQHQPGDGPLQILSVGHLTPMRSRAELIAAAASLVREGLSFNIRILGKICTEEPLRQVRELGIADRVVFLGEQPRERVLEELCACDVHAMWITNPGVGSAGMEAMCVGVPTMMWASPDQLGFVSLEHMENAVLIDPGTPQTIVDSLRLLAGDKGLRERIGRKARALARQNFAWPAAAARMESIYDSIVVGGTRQTR